MSTNKEEIVQFWSIFRKLIYVFQIRIDALLLIDAAGESPPLKDWNDVMKKNLRTHYATASKRNEARLELDAIQVEVRMLQHRVLSSTSSLAVDGSSHSNNALDELLSRPMPDLALTDIRLLTAEIEKMLAQIDAARESICPKEKFVFRRYRRVLDELNQNGGGELSNALDSLKIGKGMQKQQHQEQQPEQQISVLNFGGVVDDKSDSFIEVQSDGSINQTRNDNHEHWSTYATPRAVGQTADTGKSSYLIRNIRNSMIIIHSTLQSLHIQNIHNCKIHASVLGPVHVTNCHDSEIRCSAYQLRVHDSKSITFGVWVRSGPIIEDCTCMVFAGDFYTSSSEPGRNMFWDVKDFKWLRSLRKSPNFTVIEHNAHDDSGAVGSENASNTVNKEIDSKKHYVEVDEDSEDEL